MITERMLGCTTDNMIIYDAGPIKISISGWDEKINITTEERWSHLLPEFIITATEAWDLQAQQIKYISPTNIEIHYNFNNLKLYIEHSIIFS